MLVVAFAIDPIFGEVLVAEALPLLAGMARLRLELFFADGCIGPGGEDVAVAFQFDVFPGSLEESGDVGLEFAFVCRVFEEPAEAVGEVGLV